MPEASTKQPPRYNVIAELHDGPGRRACRAREAESGDEVVLHTWPRDLAPRALIIELQSTLPAYVALESGRLLRTRSLRADAENIVLECDYVAGESLDRMLVREPQVAPARALAIAEDVIDAIVVLHAGGVTHGAVRPSTVWIDRAGRARLLGAGVGPLLARLDAASVPVPPERRAARDVYEAAALLYRMIEGRDPSPRERWPETIGEAVNRIFASVSPWSADEPRPDAATALAMIRQARGASDRSGVDPAAAPSLLDDVEPDSPLTPTPRERVLAAARAGARRIWELVTGSAWPTLAAAATAALLAALLAGPFLGREAWWPEASRSAQPMPPGSALPAGTPVAPRTEPVAPAARPPEPKTLTEWDRAREEAAALAEIGEYEAAMLLLLKTQAPPEALAEERNAVTARAEAQFRETRELAQRLAQAGHLQFAKLEWDNLAPYWPDGAMRRAAGEERGVLDAIAKEAIERRVRADIERARRDLEAELARVLRDCLLRDEGTNDERMRKADALFKKAIEANHTEVRDDADALQSVLTMERIYVQAVRETIRKRARRARIDAVSRRFGAGDIVELKGDALVVRRQDGTDAEVPLSRMTGRERYALFSSFRTQVGGPEGVALAALCLRTRLIEEARQEIWQADQLRGVDRQCRTLRRALEEISR